MSKEEDNNVFVVSSDNESQTIIKKKKLGGLQEFSFIALCRVSYFNLVSVRFGTILLWFSLFGLSDIERSSDQKPVWLL